MIIGISGKAQSGKDTVCSMIQYCIWYYGEYSRYKEAGYEGYNGNFSAEHFSYCRDLCIELRSTFRRHSFAACLKDMLAALLDVHYESFENIDFKNSKIDWLEDTTVRELLQKVGTAMRGIDPCFWVKALLKDYTGKPKDNWIISDVRYLTEAQGIRNKDKNSILIRVNKPGVKLMNHPSETELDDYKDWDIVINNDGTLDDLLIKVRDFLKERKLLYQI